MIRVRLLALLFLLLVSACAEKPREALTTVLVGIEPAAPVMNGKSYAEILASWKKKGLRAHTVVHFAPVDGLAPIPKERLKMLKSSLDGAQVSDGENGVSGNDYLFAAVQLGMVSEIYWVMPYDFIDYIDSETRVKQFLKGSAPHFSQSEIDSLQLKNGCISGTLSTAAVRICSINQLPIIQQPVLFTVSDGFFPAFSMARKKNILGGMKLFYDTIASRKLRVNSLSILAEPETPARRGYIMDELRELFEKPEKFGKSRPPELWILRDSADNMLSGGGVTEALALLGKKGTGYSDDVYIAIMRATAELLLDMHAAGMTTFEKNCPSSPLFCRGLVDAGLMLKSQGKTSSAADIFKRAMELNPGDSRAKLEYDRIIKSQAER